MLWNKAFVVRALLTSLIDQHRYLISFPRADVASKIYSLQLSLFPRWYNSSKVYLFLNVLSDNTSGSLTSEQDYELCKKGEVLESYVLRGGRKAGAYYKIGSAATHDECVDLCCSNDDCNLALFVKSSCYSVECKSAELCKPIKVHRKTGIRPWIFRRYHGRSRNYGISYYIIF